MNNTCTKRIIEVKQSENVCTCKRKRKSDVWNNSKSL